MTAKVNAAFSNIRAHIHKPTVPLSLIFLIVSVPLMSDKCMKLASKAKDNRDWFVNAGSTFVYDACSGQKIDKDKKR